MNSRTENSKKNLVNGIINQSLVLFLSFISRTVFIKLLGAEYLGINGLYTNILSILSLTELGISNIALFTLYKPLAENNRKKISQLVNFYDKLYFVIFLLVIFFGLLFVPFLNGIIDTNMNVKELIFYYLLYLLNTAFSYICISRRILVNADQKNYIIKNVSSLFAIVQFIFQMFVLYMYKSYYLYLIIQCICTLLINIFIHIKSNKIYKFIKSDEILDVKEKKSILSQTKDLFIYKISVTLVNSVDNIFISLLLGTIIVGYYSNYNMIIMMIINIINLIISSISSSIGNLNATSSNEFKQDFFYKLLFIMQWIVAFSTCCMMLLFNDFIILWIGRTYIFSNTTVLIICLNFYLAYVISPIWIFRETMGLFKDVKYVMLFTAILNIILTYILGLIFGLSGIFLATIISRLLTTVWYEPRILFKKHFNTTPKKYYLSQITYLLVFLITLVTIYFITNFMVVTNYFEWFSKAILITIIFNLIYVVIYYKNNKFKYIVKKLFDFKK